jgi:hypothetical protein
VPKYFLFICIRIASSDGQRFSLIARSDNAFTFGVYPTYIHTYTCRLYLFTLASTTLQADFHQGVSIATATATRSGTEIAQT